MCTWTFAHFLTFAIYSALAGYVLYKNVRSPLNRTCAGILVAFAVWSFGTVTLHEVHASRDLVSRMMNISSIGWFSFSAFGVWFILVFTERRSVLEQKWFLPALFFFPLDD